ncbi:STAS domain-containing protein [Kitasatospora sp. NPDC059722]|uniref:STAS domain-containing protein n=1 Tax=Kitasatospora sp. NPDC059722 TaxID=3346925 RepID=UPI0036AC2C7E
MEPIVDPTGELSITYEHLSDRMTTMRAAGSLDVYTAPWLRTVLVDLIAHGHTLLVFDLNELELLDSTGMHVLVDSFKRVRAQEGLVAITTNRVRILRFFRITGLTKVFPILANAHEAEAWVMRESHIGSA